MARRALRGLCHRPCCRAVPGAVGTASGGGYDDPACPIADARSASADADRCGSSADCSRRRAFRRAVLRSSASGGVGAGRLDARTELPRLHHPGGSSQLALGILIFVGDRSSQASACRSANPSVASRRAPRFPETRLQRQRSGHRRGHRPIPAAGRRLADHRRTGAGDGGCPAVERQLPSNHVHHHGRWRRRVPADCGHGSDGRERRSPG